MFEKRRKLMPALIYRDQNHQMDVLIFENKAVACRKNQSTKEAVDNLFENVQNSREIVNQSFISTAYFTPKFVPIKFSESIACTSWSTKKTYTSSVELKRKYVTRVKIAANPIADDDLGENEITWETRKQIYRPQETNMEAPSILVSEAVD